MGVLDACGVEIMLLGSVPVRSGMFAESVKAPKGLTTGSNFLKWGETYVYLIAPPFKAMVLSILCTLSHISGMSLNSLQ